MKGRWGERFHRRVSPEFRAPFPAVLCRGASGPERRRVYEMLARGTKIGKATAFRSCPQQRLIVGLSEPMKHHLDTIWSLRAGLSG
jgi:hypothetical protein